MRRIATRGDRIVWAKGKKVETFSLQAFMECTEPIKGHVVDVDPKKMKGSIIAVHISLDDRYIIAGTDRGTIIRLDLHEQNNQIVSVGNFIKSVHVDHTHIFVDHYHDGITVFSLSTMEKLYVIPRIFNCFHVLDMIWANTYDGHLLQIDPITQECKKVQVNDPMFITGLVATPDHLILGMSNGFVKCLTRSTQQEIWNLDIGESDECSIKLAISPDQTMVVAVGGRCGRGVDFIMIKTGYHLYTVEDPYGYTKKYHLMRGITFKESGNQILMWDDRGEFTLYVPMACGVISSLFFNITVSRALWQRMKYR